MRNTKLECVHLIASIVIAANLAACGGAGDNATPPPPALTGNQINPVPRDQIRDGGTFTWPLPRIPTNYNYNHLDGATFEGALVIGAMMPTTYTNDALGKPVWNRDILASEPTVVTEPKQVVTFRINPKAIWYDGTPITWEDFHWQWKSSNGTDQRFHIASSTGWDVLESVERGQDDREVVVTYREKFAEWQATFNYFYPAATNKDPKLFNEGWLEKPLTTAGPFKFASLDKTAQTITFVRNEKWWGDPAKLDTIVFRAIEVDAQIDALANGELDAMELGPDASMYSRARQIPGVEIRSASGPNFRHLTLNGTSALLSDVTVRRAIGMAFDRQTFTKAMLTPLGMEPKILNNHIFMSNQDGYRDNLSALGEYNPERAKQVLDSAGWKLDGIARKKDGKTLELRLVIPAGVAVSRQEAEMVQNMLTQIGVGVRIEAVPLREFQSRYVTVGNYDMSIFSWMGTPYPISAAKSLYANPKKRADGGLDVQQNYARTGSPEIDRLLGLANQEFDRAKAQELANRADSLLWSLVHSLTTYQRPELIPAKKDLANFGAFGIAEPWIYQDIGWMKK